MNMMLWLDLMNDLGFSENRQEFEGIKKCYSENHRHYHNSLHVVDCLEKAEILDETRTNGALKLAIWYHDIVYQPFKKNNELRSAEQATKFIEEQSGSEKLKTRVYKLIMATIHKEEPRDTEEAYIMDIDISILGSDPHSYEYYCDQIRKEYRLVPWFLYRRKRIEIMEMFINRKYLYYTDYFRNKYEINARENIKNELVRLKN